MERYFLDTNVIIRLITQDNAEQGEQAYFLFKQVEAGTAQVVTSEGVIVEAVQVLSSKRLYALPRQDIQRDLAAVIMLKGLSLPGKGTYVKALATYASSKMDFVDALNLAHMERTGIKRIISFDRDFEGLPGVTRCDPASIGKN